MIEFMKLPFGENELEPAVSNETVKIHYGRHHRAYVDKVNELIIGTEFAGLSLEDIIIKTFGDTAQQTLHNNAGQVYNHNVYWNSVGIWERLDKKVKDEILLQFGARESFLMRLVEAGLQVFGSGWVWLVKDKQGNYDVMSTKNGDTPLPFDYEIVFNIDVWEHAYYLDYQQNRRQYLLNFIEQVLNI